MDGSYSWIDGGGGGWGLGLVGARLFNGEAEAETWIWTWIWTWDWTWDWTLVENNGGIEMEVEAEGLMGHCPEQCLVGS